MTNVISLQFGDINEDLAEDNQQLEQLDNNIMNLMKSLTHKAQKQEQDLDNVSDISSVSDDKPTMSPYNVFQHNRHELMNRINDILLLHKLAELPYDKADIIGNTLISEAINDMAKTLGL